MFACNHEALLFHSLGPGKPKYRQPAPAALQEAIIAREPKRKKGKSTEKPADGRPLPDAATFPAPVVLPEDELAEDPDYPPQTVQYWIDGEHRNAVTRRQRTIYVAAPPSYINSRLQRALKHGAAFRMTSATFVEYLTAFYHPLPVKLLDQQLGYRFRRSRPKATVHHALGLAAADSMTHVSRRRGGLNNFQLSVNDLIDAAISLLPADAYALLTLVNEDLYEDDFDAFISGRAYGGSRVAVVSTARYNPVLDEVQKVERLHSWPASHCLFNICRQWRLKHPVVEKPPLLERDTALAAAIRAANAVAPPETEAEMTARGLGRVCKTASHELGHCFGMDHCVSYACIMQGSANLAEDARQPPYVCPVDLAKVLRAIGADERERYEMLLEFSGKGESERMFAAWKAWLEKRLRDLR